MVSFKVTQNRKSKPLPITKENFEKNAIPVTRYKGKDSKGFTQYNAVCPFCDNPIIIHGLYEKTKVSDKPYGSHIQNDTEYFTFDRETFSHCPAYTGRRTPAKDDRLARIHQVNYEIYNSLRENLPSAVYILRQSTGIYFNNKAIRQMLVEYLDSAGYLYTDAATYNIPWMLLYMAHDQIPLYGQLISKKSPAFEFVKGFTGVKLDRYFTKEGESTDYYYIGKKTKYLNLRLDFYGHDRRLDNDQGSLKEYVIMRLCTTDYKKVFGTSSEGKKLYEDKIVLSHRLEINEFRYPNLVASENRPENEVLDNMARELMPKIPAPEDTI